MVSKSPTVEAIIRSVWELVGAGAATGVGYDGVRVFLAPISPTSEQVSAARYPIPPVHIVRHSPRALQDTLRIARYHSRSWTGRYCAECCPAR
jgi:hypothetical protein